MYAPHWLGSEGEKIAARYLVTQGYRIVECNYRFHRNEIDIIAYDGDELCFIEVKTRASLDTGHPAESVTPRKIREIVRAASGYLTTLPDPWINCRFDVIAILARQIDDQSIISHELEHLKAAFMTGDSA